MVETVYDFDEFKRRMSDYGVKPHWDAWSQPVDKHGIVHKVVFQLTAPANYIVERLVDEPIIQFERQVFIDTLSEEFCRKYAEKTQDDRFGKARQDVINDLLEKYAKPVGATSGRWERRADRP